jgi:hypothetical protein
MLNRNKRLYILGAPWSTQYIREYEIAAQTRFTRAGTPDWEKACDYAIRIIDRQINKARGVLTYNGLLFTALTFAGSRLAQESKSTTLPLLGASLALLACIPLLSLMVVRWASVDEFANAQADFQRMSRQARHRTYVLTMCLYVSVFTTVLAFFSISLVLK